MKKFPTMLCRQINILAFGIFHLLNVGNKHGITGAEGAYAWSTYEVDKVQVQSLHVSANYTQHEHVYLQDGKEISTRYRTYYSEEHCRPVYGKLKVTGKHLPDVSRFALDVYSSSCGYFPKFSNTKNFADRESVVKSFDIQIGGEQSYASREGDNFLIMTTLMPNYFSKLPASTAAPCNILLPIYDSILRGNWYQSLKTVNQFLDKHGKDEYEIHTMTAGSLTVPSNIGIPLSMYAWKQDEKLRSLMSIPEMFIAVTIYRPTNKGWALVTLNDPYITSDQAKKRSEQLCPYWRTTSGYYWDNYDPKKGYSFQCYVHDLFRSDGGIPSNPDEKFSEIDHMLFY